MGFFLPLGADVVDLTDDQEQVPLVDEVDGAGDRQDAEQHEQYLPATWNVPYDNANGLAEFIDWGQDMAPAIPAPGGGLQYLPVGMPPGPQDFVDLTGEAPFVPNETRPAIHFDSISPEKPKAEDDLSSTQTREECLEKLLLIFPNIDPDYVYQLWEKDQKEPGIDRQNSSTHERLADEIIAEPHYPRMAKGKQADRKRKRAESDGDENRLNKFRRYETRERPRGVIQNCRLIGSMLKAEFPEMTHNYIKSIWTQQGHLFQTYIALAQERDNSRVGRPVFGRGRPKSGLADAEVIAGGRNRLDLVEELKAAREKVAIMREQRAAERKFKEEEEKNLSFAIAAGNIAECQACFDELPMNRQIHCSGDQPHFTCLSCAEMYIKTEVGESRCRVLCTAGCGAGFEPAQLNLLPNKQLLEKLSQLQQEKDIRDAGIEDLEECPFCDYKAILPPVEEDFEFRCANPECEKVSCRRCKAISHTPVSCEQHAKDHRLNSRHRLEEAMTAALIRSCNKCKKQYIKDYGCNKMTCPSCGTLQCYACSETVTDYDHFDNGQGIGPGSADGAKRRCPLQDNVEERHAREVREAEAAMRAQILAENPAVTEADLDLKQSESEKSKMPVPQLQLPGEPIAHLLGVFNHHRPNNGRNRVLFDRMMQVHAAANARPAQMQFGGDAAMDARRPQPLPLADGEHPTVNARNPFAAVNPDRAQQLRPHNPFAFDRNRRANLFDNEPLQGVDFHEPNLLLHPPLPMLPPDPGIAHEHDATPPPPEPDADLREDSPAPTQNAHQRPASSVGEQNFAREIVPWPQQHPPVPLFDVPALPQFAGAWAPYGIANYPVHDPGALHANFYHGFLPFPIAGYDHGLQAGMYTLGGAPMPRVVAAGERDPVHGFMIPGFNPQLGMPWIMPNQFF